MSRRYRGGVSCEIFSPTFSPLLMRVSTKYEPN
jgi:hypothetical protein